MGLGKFNSDDHYIYYCGEELLRRNGVALIVNNRVLNIVLGCSFKNDRMISVCLQSKPLSITVIQFCVPSNSSLCPQPRLSKKLKLMGLYEDLQDLLEINEKGWPFHQRNAKVGSQEKTGKFGLVVQNEAGQSLTEFSQENMLVIANTLSQQHKR